MREGQQSPHNFTYFLATGVKVAYKPCFPSDFFPGRTLGFAAGAGCNR
ncbi:protein of unknown function [Paraburkholderia dioscoreae]|uniref:Uncharacterized protein n=1 Tax=Paraburkholderia dioscoreae TaxID=2604047 RepID=A0A5Q4ZJM9_9BURK|nr:protein of unknown function [Paraburkholderia dioscoreae]